MRSSADHKSVGCVGYRQQGVYPPDMTIENLSSVPVGGGRFLRLYFTFVIAMLLVKLRMVWN